MAATREFESEYFIANYPDYLALNPLRKMRFYRRLIERNLAPDVPHRIHDIGCAFGHFLSTFHESWEIFGSDVSNFAIECASKTMSYGTFKVAGASDAAVFPGQFGVVTALDVMEHVPQPDRAAQSIADQLLDNGCFLFVVPVYDGLSGPLIRRLDRDPTHIHKWRRRRWIDWAQSHFIISEWCGILRYLVPFRYYLHIPTYKFRNYTPAIAVVCRKASKSLPLPANR